MKLCLGQVKSIRTTDTDMNNQCWYPWKKDWCEYLGRTTEIQMESRHKGN